MYDPESLPLPESFYDPHEGSLPHIKRMVAERGKDARGPFTFSCNEAQLKQATAVEYGSLTLFDEALGQLLGSLERMGIADDTIIIFSADHGDMFGDHGLMLKFAAHYQGTINVPLLVSGAGIEPGESEALVGLVDLGRTILDLTDCPPYIGMQGHSLRPILEDPQAAVRDAILIEEAYQSDFLDIGQDMSLKTVVTADARLTLYQGFDGGELYDLKNDPAELNNLYGKPEAIQLQLEMVEKLAREMMAHSDLSRYPL